MKYFVVLFALVASAFAGKILLDNCEFYEGNLRFSTFLAPQFFPGGNFGASQSAAAAQAASQTQSFNSPFGGFAPNFAGSAANANAASQSFNSGFGGLGASQSAAAAQAQSASFNSGVSPFFGNNFGASAAQAGNVCLFYFNLICFSSIWSRLD